MSRLVTLWVLLVTAAVPPGPRDRRREELAAHHREARAAGGTPMELARATARGALDDLRWCRDERAHAGWSPLVVAPGGSTVIAGICILGTLLTSLKDTWMANVALHTVLPRVAAAVLIVSYADLLWRRRRPRDQVVDDPIFPL
jgi:hypothetical protein